MADGTLVWLCWFLPARAKRRVGLQLTRGIHRLPFFVCLFCFFFLFVCLFFSTISAVLIFQPEFQGGHFWPEFQGRHFSTGISGGTFFHRNFRGDIFDRNFRGDIFPQEFQGGHFSTGISGGLFQAEFQGGHCLYFHTKTSVRKCAS